MTESESNTYLAPFKPIEAMMAEYKAENDKLVFDYRDVAGNKLARSHVFKLRQVKTKITDLHKAVKADALEACRKIDGIKNQLIGQVEEMITVHNEPLMVIEKEKAEAEAEKQRVIKEAADKAEQERLAEIERREAEVKAREDAVKAAERKKEREEAARKAEAERVEREKLIADQARVKAEADAKAALEAAHKKHEAELEAQRQRLIAEQQAKELAERKRREAEEAEKARKAEIERKVKSDEKHRAEIHSDIVDRLMEMGLSPVLSGTIVTALKEGTIPHVKIEY